MAIVSHIFNWFLFIMSWKEKKKSRNMYSPQEGMLFKLQPILLYDNICYCEKGKLSAKPESFI